MTAHVFAESLAMSHAQADAPWWDQVYHVAFPTMVSMQSVRDDGWAQRGGIDRIIHLRDGTGVKIDEKVRYQEYNDILIEVWSDRDRKVKGWIQRDLTCDYIAYAFVESGRCYLLPWLLLKRAWLEHKREWAAAGYRVVDAKNTTYTTRSVAVPTDVLLDCIRGAMLVEVPNVP